jgi:hypothetical protein
MLRVVCVGNSPRADHPPGVAGAQPRVLIFWRPCCSVGEGASVAHDHTGLERRRSKRREWLEAECLKLARQISGGSQIERIDIRRVNSGGTGQNWKVADIIAQPPLLVIREVRAKLALKVVADQVGAPISAAVIANVLASIVSGNSERLPEQFDRAGGLVQLPEISVHQLKRLADRSCTSSSYSAEMSRPV